ncbi:MAG: hypothetical protein PHF44_02075 [Candidatus Pacebacteria bacterium]|nr:hypothetical protein [Candidatus Paceibacterota bacterium]
MKKKVLIIIGILPAFLLVALIALFFILRVIAPPDEMGFGWDGISSNGTLPWLKWTILDQKQINQKLLPLYAPAQNFDPLALCEKITSNEEKFTCLAIIKNDKKICDNINDSDEKNYCDLKLDEVAGLSPALCEQREGYLKQECYATLAINEKDPSFCGKIDDGVDKDLCFYNVAVEAENKTFCERIADENFYYMESCFMAVAEKNGDFATCDEIADSQKKKSCKQDIKNSMLQNKAISENSPSLCNQIKSPDGGISALLNENDEKKYLRDNCYYETAIANKNAEICKKIKEECQQAICIAEIKNPYACERCKDEACCGVISMRQSCYNKAAISLEDPSFCGDATITQGKNECYFLIALKSAGIDIKDFLHEY